MTFISKEDCGKGENCPVHYRVSEHDTRDLISLIDYVGAYAVHTLETDISDALWAFASNEDIFDFRVKVFHVGENGTLADIADDPEVLLERKVRDEGYELPDEIQTDEEFLEQIMAAHMVTVGLVRSGVIAV